MNEFKDIIRKDLQNFIPYVSARSEKTKGRVWLNANEWPWNKTYTDEGYDNLFSHLNRYPESQPSELINALAKFYKIGKDQLVVTRGSNEGIDLLVRLCCTPAKDQIIICSPTFDMYVNCAQLQGANVIDIPLIEHNFQLDIAKLKKVLKRKVKIIFLCSPNNPTGNLLNKKDIFSLCDLTKDKCLIVVDEAYIEFADEESLAKNVNDHNNLIVLRTLSKVFGLAGVRMGALLGNNSILQWIKKIMPPYPLPSPSVEIVLLQLKNANVRGIFNAIEKLKKERDRLKLALQKISFVETIWPSQANFLLVLFSTEVFAYLKKQGIVVRNMGNKFNMKNMVRISVGTPAENSELIKALKLIGAVYEQS